MHLAERGFQLVLLSALLAIAGQWGDDPSLRMLWGWPALLLLVGLLAERLLAQRTALVASIAGPRVLLLGRAQPMSVQFEHNSRRRLTLQFAPVVPAGFSLLGDPRIIEVPRDAPAGWSCSVTALRLGSHDWPDLPVRLSGRFGLAWWSRSLAPQCRLAVAPDTLSVPPTRARGTHSGANARLRPGHGAELLQLRDYVRSDPLSRIDWKTTARLGRLTTREYSEDQHLDILLAIDAGRLSRVRAGELDRLGLYANIAARFAQHAVLRDDRVGLLVYAERPLAVCAPARGLRAVAALREQLMRLSPQRGESEPLGAALRMRALLSQRSLIVLLTDLEDVTTGAALRSAVLALMPPHLALVAGVRSADVADLAVLPARAWRDPWISLAAQTELRRTQRHLTHLRATGSPVVYVPELQLEQAVFDAYETLRLRRLRPEPRTGVRQ